MNFYLKFYIFLNALSLIRSHTHDEISKCSLTGVYKARQTVLESPNYPDNYKPDTCWDYVLRSPYKCPTTFHIQFLDFYLESSKDCKNDYLAIGLENVDDDMDVLCGQVVGIKKYHTPDGVLRLRFFADESPWTTGKGFKLLVTRLACEREELLRRLKDEDDDDEPDDDDTIAVSAPSGKIKPPESELMQIFRNLTGDEQYQLVPIPPVFGINYPTQLPSPPYPSTGTVYVPASESRGPLPNYPGSNVQSNLQPPCTDNDQQRQLPNTVGNYYGALSNAAQQTLSPFIGQNNYLPNFIATNNQPGGQVQPLGAPNNGILSNPRDQYIGAWPSTPSLLRAYENNNYENLEACCVSAFQQKRFYLSSPGFPRTIFSNILPNVQKRDCVFRIQKSSASVCRLRLDFKFFDFGQSYQGTGSFVGNIGYPAIQNTQNVCKEDFIEIDNQRFCGCRSGNMFTAYWNTAADKKLRMRQGYSGSTSGGFLLELVQEQCTESQLAMQTTKRPIGATTMNPNLISNQVFNGLQNPALLQQQQPQNLYGGSYPNQQQVPQNSFAGSSYPTQQPHQPQQQQQNFYGNSYYQGQQQPFLQNPGYLTQQQQQQLFNPPGGFSSHLQQQNPFFNNPQQTYPSQFGLNYQDLQHNLLQQPLHTNPFGLSQIRYARSYKDQQETPLPVTVVETNSTRKEYYYSNEDSSNFNENSSLLSRSGSSEITSSSKWDRKDTKVSDRDDTVGIANASAVRESRKCTFDMGDILRLSVDVLWVTKPICYAPQRNWFTNWIG